MALLRPECRPCDRYCLLFMRTKKEATKRGEATKNLSQVGKILARRGAQGRAVARVHSSAERHGTLSLSRLARVQHRRLERLEPDPTTQLH